MPISGLGHLMSIYLMKCFPQRQQGKAAPNNLFDKMPSEAQSQSHASVTWRPTGEQAPQQKARFHRHRSSAKLDSSPSPRSPTAEGSEHIPPRAPLP